MTTFQYRLLLIASLIIDFIGGGIDVMFPQLLPEAFHQVQAEQDLALTTENSFVLAGLSIVAIVLLIVSYYGLFMLRRWAPMVAVVFTILSLVCYPLMGAVAQSGLAVSISYFASYLWGAIIVLAFIKPFDR